MSRKDEERVRDEKQEQGGGKRSAPFGLVTPGPSVALKGLSSSLPGRETAVMCAGTGAGEANVGPWVHTSWTPALQRPGDGGLCGEKAHGVDERGHWWWRVRRW